MVYGKKEHCNARNISVFTKEDPVHKFRKTWKANARVKWIKEKWEKNTNNSGFAVKLVERSKHRLTSLISFLRRKEMQHRHRGYAGLMTQ